MYLLFLFTYYRAGIPKPFFQLKSFVIVYFNIELMISFSSTQTPV